MLCDELYSALEMDCPPYGAPRNYVAVVTEIEKRELRAERQPESHHD